MKAVLLAIALLLSTAAVAAAHPTYVFCGKHGHCTTPQRAYVVLCGGWDWWTPRHWYVPPKKRHNPRAWGWCEDNVPVF